MAQIFYLRDPSLLTTQSGKLALGGKSDKDDRFVKGSYITTTPIVDIDKYNVITTKSGSLYRLIIGDPKSVEETLMNLNKIEDILRTIREYVLRLKHSTK